MFLLIESDALCGVNNWTLQIFLFGFSSRSGLLSLTVRVHKAWTLQIFLISFTSWSLLLSLCWTLQILLLGYSTGLLLIVWCLALCFKLIVDVLLWLEIAGLVGLELNRFEYICTCILYSTVVSLEESLVHELLKWSAVAHLKEVLRKLLSLFISKFSLFFVGWCTLVRLRLLSLGNLGPHTDRIILLLGLCLCLWLSAVIPSQSVLRLGLSLLLHLISATAILGLGLHLSLSLKSTSWPAKGTASLLSLRLSLLLSLHAGH